MRTREKEIARGFEIGAVVGGFILVSFFTVLIPTNEFRARFYFLLGMSGPPTIELALFAILGLVGLILLGIFGLWSSGHVFGVLAAAATHVALLWSGAYRILPEFSTIPER